MKFHHLIVPIAFAMTMVGLALLAGPRNLGLLRALGSDLVVALGNALIVFGVFSIASYAVVRAVEWADLQKEKPRRSRG